MVSVPLIQIPILDTTRAVAFYEKVLGSELTVHESDGRSVVFLTNPEAADGARVMLLKSDNFDASSSGTLCYLGLDGPMDGAIARIKEAGGEITFDKFGTHNEQGFICNFRDSEGNTVGIATKE